MTNREDKQKTYVLGIGKLNYDRDDEYFSVITVTTTNSDSKVNIQSEGWWFFKVFDSDRNSVTPEPDDRTLMNSVFIPMPGERMVHTHHRRHSDNLSRGHQGGANHSHAIPTQSSYTPVRSKASGTRSSSVVPRRGRWGDNHCDERFCWP